MKIAFISSNSQRYVQFLRDHPEYTKQDVIFVNNFEKIAGLEIDNYFIDECKEMTDEEHNKIFNYLPTRLRK